MLTRSWEQCWRDPDHTIYIDDLVHDRTEAGYFVVRYLVMRGLYALNVYVGVTEGIASAGWPYYLVPLYVHGGLTFSSLGDGKVWPADWWWYGWDYAHAGDRSWAELELPSLPRSRSRLRTWTPDLVAPEARRAAEQMLALVVMGWQPKQEEIREYLQEEEQRGSSMSPQSGKLKGLAQADD